MTKEEQEKMRQGIEKHPETKPSEVAVTVMFHDRKAFLAVTDSFRARGNAALSLSDPLAADFLVASPVPSLPSILNVGVTRTLSYRRTRRRTLSQIEKFSAEVSKARSAWFVFGASPNSLSQTAAANPTITMTEQRRCAAA